MVITTSAPTNRYLTACSALSTPVAAASEPRTCPASTPIHNKGLDSLGALYDDTHRFADAEAAYKEAADIRRALAAQNPAAYRPDLAQTLDSLGALYDDTHRLADAEAAYKEAADIQRALAAQNPAAYRTDLAQTLNNLASLYRDMHRYHNAKVVEAEARAAASMR